jgi:predicted metal-binding membrane protein
VGRHERHAQRAFRALRLGGLDLRHDRIIVGLSLAGVTALAWLYLWHDSHSMTHPAPFALTFMMWVVMMIGMMLPSAAPTVLLYGQMVRKNAARGSMLPAAWIFVSGYVLVWAGFSLAAAFAQVALEHVALLTPMLEPASGKLTGVLLLVAGIYQWTPLKDVCLSKCRSPVHFFMTHWRPGTAGALRMGATHGLYCVGCCWMLMLLLFAVGVMNLAWIALIAGFVFVEKLLPGARIVSRLAGVLLVVLGAAVLAFSA